MLTTNVVAKQKMNQLRLDAEDSQSKLEEALAKIKALEQENLAKEQEITSLQHKNGLLESEVEKLETSIKDLKKAADEGTQHGTQNESLNRRLQLLEEEAEQADKTLREANEKYVVATHVDKKAALAAPLPTFLQRLQKYPLSTKGDLFPWLTWCLLSL